MSYGVAWAETEALFLPLTAQRDAIKTASVAHDKQIVKARAVGVNLNLLKNHIADFAENPNQKQKLHLNLFEEAGFIAELDHVELTVQGVAWVGRVRDVLNSQVILVISGDLLVGNVISPAWRYHIRMRGDGTHEVQAIDSLRFDQDEPFTPVPVRNHLSAENEKDTPGMNSDDGSTIDVMVVYSTSARLAAGSAVAVRSLIDLAVLETNLSYIHGGLTQRIRLVHTEEVAYNESQVDPLYAALMCITNPTDGCLDEIHALRDTYGADLVSFWLEAGGGYCGLAWHMDSVGSWFAPYGFSAVARSCASGNYSFSHELGHNMGARHDVFVDSGDTPYPYAHGFAYPPEGWRTIMAYNTACIHQGTNCVRLPHWSNPGITRNGVAMGDTTADNRSSLNNTAWTVANFRQSQGPIVPALKNRVPVKDLFGSAGSETHYVMRIPKGGRSFRVAIEGGNGDADLYVRYGSAPTTSEYDCRPYNPGNQEVCDFLSPQSGNWCVMVRGNMYFTGLTLTGNYSINMSPVFWLLLTE
jgi:hypothetical protein